METFKEQLLLVMEGKHHGAFVHLTRPGLSRQQLLTHFQHEYVTYIRDFPVLLARTLGQGPPQDVRQALAENIYEEQTGELSVGTSHPELFLTMMAGLGIPRSALEQFSLADAVPQARAYREFLDQVSASPPWIVGAAVLTIFVEGSVHERAELTGARKLPPVEDAIAEHPLVKFYGCPKEAMELTRAHRLVESDHRADAWRSVLGYAHALGAETAVTAAMKQAQQLWLAYRDGVAHAMGVEVLPV